MTIEYVVEVRDEHGTAIKRSGPYPDLDAANVVGMLELDYARAFHGMQCEAFIITKVEK